MKAIHADADDNQLLAVEKCFVGLILSLSQYPQSLGWTDAILTEWHAILSTIFERIDGSLLLFYR